MKSDRTALAICSIFKDALAYYGDSMLNKLIMQIYDGASVMSGHISGVKTR